MDKLLIAAVSFAIGLGLSHLVGWDAGYTEYEFACVAVVIGLVVTGRIRFGR